jgi:hypothetical protein
VIATNPRRSVPSLSRGGVAAHPLAFLHEAHDDLQQLDGSAPGSPAYFVNEGTLGTNLSVWLSKLHRPRDAVEAARNALARSGWRHGFVLVRLGAALVGAREIGEAARVLGDAAGLAGISPRVTSELRAARAGMAPWQATPAVKALDEQLAAYGIVLN